MSDQAEKKDDIKKHVRALLLSSPAPLTVHELERDFFNFIGVRLAYRDIGYASIEDFLRDIDDAVAISYKNGVMVLKANADETTKHIEKLVSKQKVTNKKKYAVYRSRGGGGPPRMYQGTNRYTPRRAATNRVPPQPVVPAYVRKQMKELFRSFPDGVPVTHLDSAFSKIYGTGINYRNFGFQNQYEFLQSLKDILTVEELDRGEWFVMPVGYSRVSVTQPKRPEIPRFNRHNVPSERTEIPRFDRYSTQAERPEIPRFNRQSTVDDHWTTEPVQQSTSHKQQSLQANNQKRPSKGRGRRRENSGDVDVTVGQDAQSVCSTNSQNDEHLEREIQQVLETKPNGIWASRFPFEFAELHGRPLDYREHGYLSVIDFLSAMPDTVRTVRPNPHGDWMLYDARLPDPNVKDSEKSRSRHCSGKTMETETKEAIQIILSGRPCGITVKEFPDVFKEYTGRRLPVTDLGFDSPEDLFLSLADSILQFAYNGNEMLMYSMDIEITETEQEASTSLSQGMPQDNDYPADAVGPGCHFVPVMLPNPEQYVELYVTNVVNPGLFWVMLRHKTKSLALEALMDQLDEVYEKEREADIYRMPENLMVPGQVCATLFPEDNNWHRGVITGCNEAGFIEVYYVDYGNTNFVQKSTIRFLKSQFLTLPAQAVQARLANTHPQTGVTGRWKNKCRSRLLELTCHRPLVAYICDVKSQKMSLCLTDTNQATVDVHINDVMVSEGLAMFIPDAEVQTPANANKHSMEPDYGHVFGWSTTDTPRLPKAAQNMSQSEHKEVIEEAHCYVKWIQVDESCVLHLINLNRQAYIVSAEISELFWEEDILTSMLKKKRVEVEKRVVSSDEFPILFQELVKYKVKSVMCNGGTKQQFLSLYKLDSLPKILQVFDHESETLLIAVQELILKFDPDSPYWKSGEVVEETPIETVQDEDSNDQPLSIEEKQMVLQALQIKRKRILQSMMNNPSSLQDEVVNQLNNCEVEIMMIKQEIEEQLSTVSDASTDKTGSQNSSKQFRKSTQEASLDRTERETENQRVIQNIIASSSKPIAAANIMTKPVTSTTVTKPLPSSSQSANQSNMNDIFMSQSTTGSLPGMLGAQNMAFMQQQHRMFNPMFMAQSGLPHTGMGDMANSMMAGNLGLGAGLNPGFQAGLLPQLNPLLFQLQAGHVAHMSGVGNMNPIGTMPSVGRGQPINPSSVGILPGLLPLLQNMSAGRGGRGSGQ